MYKFLLGIYLSKTLKTYTSVLQNPIIISAQIYEHAPKIVFINIVEIVTKAKIIATRNKEHLQVFKYTRRSSYNFSVVSLKASKQFIQKRVGDLLESCND